MGSLYYQALFLLLSATVDNTFFSKSSVLYKIVGTSKQISPLFALLPSP